MILPQSLQGKLLLITTDYPPDVGGVARYYENLVQKVGTGRDLSVHVLKLGKWALTPLWPFMVILIIIKSLIIKPEWWWVGQVLPIGTVVRLLSFVWRKPYIVSTHGMDILLPLKSRRKRWLVKKILERAELITANSEWTKQKIMEHYFSGSKFKVQGSKLVVMYPEPKPKRNVAQHVLDALRLKLGIPGNAKVLLTVSRLVARKGIDQVLAALPEVWKEMPEVHYVVVGDGEEREKLSVVSCQLSVGDRVHFAGRVSDEELPVYYSLADAFILLPRDIDGDAEGFGIVYLEANQYGLPIIATHSGGTSEALDQCRRVAMINDSDNTREVAHALWKQFQ